MIGIEQLRMLQKHGATCAPPRLADARRIQRGRIVTGTAARKGYAARTPWPGCVFVPNKIVHIRSCQVFGLNGVCVPRGILSLRAPLCPLRTNANHPPMNSLRPVFKEYWLHTPALAASCAVLRDWHFGCATCDGAALPGPRFPAPWIQKRMTKSSHRKQEVIMLKVSSAVQHVHFLLACSWD
jgi:hypothetical protein